MVDSERAAEPRSTERESEPSGGGGAGGGAGGRARRAIADKQSRLKLIVLATAVVLVLGFAYWWFFLRGRVSTDDAYVHAFDAQIASRIPGTVQRILVDDNYPVKAGEILLELDKTDYEVAVKRAEATLAQTEADVRASEVAISLTDAQTQAQLQAAEASLNAAGDKEKEAGHKLTELQRQKGGVAADLQLAQRDYARFSSLYRQGAGAERRREEAGVTLKKVQSQLGSLDAQIAAAQASVGGSTKDVQKAQALHREAQSARSNVEIQRFKLAALIGKRDEAKANLDAARLNLSYCTVRAPIDGYVAQRSIQLGDRIQTGQALMSVVPLHKVFVHANFKETDLTDVRVGQPAIVTADIYPGHEYKGRVAGISSGSGAAFSLLPPENATGNWVKVVRRVPVRIELDKPPSSRYPLRIGLSLEVTVYTSNKRGPLLVPASATPAAGLPITSLRKHP
jgi:membrane fusion protein (multidrug efflux system)